MRFSQVLRSLSLLTVVSVPAASRAAVLYDATTGPTYRNFDGPISRLDDMTFVLPTGGPPVRITGMSFVAVNTDTGAATTVDALATFYDNANTAATGSQVVESGPLGTARFVGVTLAAGATGTFSYTLATPVQVPDGTAAVRLEFIEPASSTASPNLSDTVDVLFARNLPTVGSTANVSWADTMDFNRSFTGNETVFPDLNANPPFNANLAIRIDGVAVPEPAALSLVAGAGLLFLRRAAR